MNHLEGHALPQAFIARMADLLQDEFPAFLAAYEAPQARGLRVNRLKVTPEALAARLEITADPVPWNPDGLYYTESLRPGSHPYHAAGLY